MLSRMAGRDGRARGLPRPEHVDSRRRAAHRRDDVLRRGVSVAACASSAGGGPCSASIRCRARSTCCVSSELLETVRQIGNGMATRERTHVITSPARSADDRTSGCGSATAASPAPTARRRARSTAARHHVLRHGAADARGRHRRQRRDVRRDRGERRAAVRARAVRGHDSRRAARGAGASLAASRVAFGQWPEAARSVSSSSRGTADRRRAVAASMRAPDCRTTGHGPPTAACCATLAARFPRRRTRCSRSATRASSSTRTTPTPRSTSIGWHVSLEAERARRSGGRTRLRDTRRNRALSRAVDGVRRHRPRRRAQVARVARGDACVAR